MTDNNGNEVPWLVGDHYHHNYYYQQRFHQSSTKVRGSLSSGGTGSTAKDRQRKRRAKVKPKSLHHLSLVTRFHLGLRMSRLRSRQRPFCPGNGNCRAKEVDGIGNSMETNEGVCHKLKEADKNVDMINNDTTKDESVPPPQHEHSGNSSELNITKNETEEILPKFDTEVKEDEKLQSDHILQPRMESAQTTRENTSVSGKEESIATPTDFNAFQNNMGNGVTQMMDTDITDISGYDLENGKDSSNNDPKHDTITLCQSASEFPGRSDELLSAGKEIQSEDNQVELTDISSEQQVLSSPIHSKSPEVQRPKIVITLHGSKPHDEIQHLKQTQKLNNNATNTPAGLNKAIATSPGSIHDNAESVKAHTSVPSSASQHFFLKPRQKTTHSNANVCEDETFTAKLMQISKGASVPEKDSLSKTGPGAGSYSTCSLANVVETTEANNRRNDQLRANLTKPTKGNIVFVVNPNVNDEVERNKLHYNNWPFQKNAEQHQVNNNDEKINSTELHGEQENKSTLEDWKQRKIIIAYNKMLWKPNFVNKENDPENRCDKNAFEKQDVSLVTDGNDAHHGGPNKENCLQIIPNALDKSKQYYVCNDNLFKSKEMVTDQSNAGTPVLFQKQNCFNVVNNRQEIDGRNPSSEEFQRLSEFYCQEQFNKRFDDLNSSFRHVSQENIEPEDKWNIPRYTKRENYNKTDSFSGRQPFFHKRGFEHLKTGTETLSKSYNGPVLNHVTPNKQYGNQNTDKNPFQINTSQIVLVPSSNVFTVTPSDLHHKFGTQCNKLIASDSSKVTWSNSSLPLQRNNSNSMSYAYTSTTFPNTVKAEKGFCQEDNDISKTLFPLKDVVTNCIVNLPCDYKIPIRKESMTEDNQIRCVTSNTMCVSHDADGQSQQPFESIRYFENKNKQQCAEKEVPVNATNTITACVDSKNTMMQSSADNVIGWVPVRLVKANDKTPNKSIVFVPTPGDNLNTMHHGKASADLETEMEDNKTTQGLPHTALPPVTLTYVTSVSDNEKVSTVSNFDAVASNHPSDQSGNILVTRQSQATPSTGSTLLSSFVPVQLSWLPVVTKTASQDASAAKASSNIWTNRKTETVDCVIKKPGAMPFTTRKAFDNEKPDKINFATPAADLLSSVAKVPILPCPKMAINNHHGVMYQKSKTAFDLKETMEYSHVSRTSNRPDIIDSLGSSNKTVLKDVTTQGIRDINAPFQLCYGQFFPSDQTVTDSEQSMDFGGQRMQWFENSRLTTSEDKCTLSKSVRQNWTSISKTQNQERKKVISMNAYMKTSNVYNAPLVLLRDQSEDGPAKMSLGVARPLVAHKPTGEKESRLNLNANHNSCESQTVNNSKFCWNEIPSAFEGQKKCMTIADVNPIKTRFGNGDLASQLYITNAFVGRQSHPPSKHPSSLPDRAEVGTEGADVLSIMTEVSNNDINSSLNINTRLEGQNCCVRSGIVQTLQAEESKSKIKTAAWEGSLFAQTASGYPGPEVFPIFGQAQDGHSTHRGLFSRCDDKRLGQDLPAQISAMSFSSTISNVLKPYKNPAGNISNNVGSPCCSSNVCPICHRRFTRPWLLKGHMRTHTGERPFLCSFPLCEKAFADKSNLRSHMQTHTAITKNFECSRCGRAFSQKRYLHKHTTEVCKYGNK